MDPSQPGHLPELLRRFTAMNVLAIEEGMRPQPNCVYVAPSSRSVALANDTFHLLELSEPRHARLPIDFFFRQLAEAQGERAVCVILSGMGTDGTLGLRAVKEKLGVAMAQAVESAKFAGMPQSAIATGLVDFVLPPDELARKLGEYVSHRISGPAPEAPSPSGHGSDEMQDVFSLLLEHTRHDFSFYKSSTLVRRIERRMSALQSTTLAQYVRTLRQNPAELETLFREMLIGVTRFFRDPEAFLLLEQQVLPELLELRRHERVFRVWVPGSSTGEEAYSVAILLKECSERLEGQAPFKFQIFATDLDKGAIEKARLGVYPANIAADLSQARLHRFFVERPEGLRIKKEICDMMVFAQQNIITDPPFTRLDLICCRNLLIYLVPELQKKLFPLFHYALNRGGVLFLGSSESAGTLSDLFSPLDSKWKLYRRRDSPTRFVAMPERSWSPAPGRAQGRPGGAQAGPPIVEVSLANLVQKSLLESSPPAVLLSPKGEILYVHGHTGKYLEPASGKMDMNIASMAREGLTFELGRAIRKVATRHRAVTLKQLSVETNGSRRTVNVTVKPVRQPEAAGCMLVIFEEMAPTPGPSQTRASRSAELDQARTIRQLEEELKLARHTVQSALEDMETSQEELKSANEELQSTNEELQSTNEELTTSREEMQSLNEELMSVNVELRSKLEELSKASDDMSNLLNSTEIATIFLDCELAIRRFTPPVSKILNLIPSDIGRSLTHLASNLRELNLLADVGEVLGSLAAKETEVRTVDGRWHLMRIMPYRTSEGVIDGLVLTFTDITAHKQLEAELGRRKSELLIRGVLDRWPGLIVVFDLVERRAVYVNERASSEMGYSREQLEAAGDPFWKSISHPDDYTSAFEVLALVEELPDGGILRRQHRVLTPAAQWRTFSSRTTVMERDQAGRPLRLLSVLEPMPDAP
ncbi:MAG: PAS domain-containing protein [Candidatus Wallbacteria bacterium]|nr:PAS domain-containing protein [Candidatus Wallbacteria bacterium]